MDALLSRDFQRGESAAERARLQSNYNQEFAQREKLYDDQSRAAKVSGVTDLLGLGLNYSLGRQYANIYKGLLGGGVGGAANIGGVTGSANIGGVFATGGQLAPPASPFVGKGMLSAYEGVGTSGLLGGLSTGAALGAAGAGFAGSSFLGPTLDKFLPGGGKFGQTVAGTAGGALAGLAAGAAAGAGLGVPGAIIGGLVGFVGSLF
jgi:hypothetical protein